MSFPIGEPFPLFLTHVELDTQSKFIHVWGQTDMPTVELIEAKMTEWEPSFNSGTYGLNPKAIVLHEMYCAKFSEDDKWYRGKTMVSKRPNEFDVHFIDFGNIEKIFGRDLRKVDADLYAIPPQAHHFLLANVVRTDVNWSIEVRDRCKQYVYEEVEAIVVGAVEHIQAVNITKRGNLRSLNDAFIEANLVTCELMLSSSNVVVTPDPRIRSSNQEVSLGYKFNEMSGGEVCGVVVVHVERDKSFWVNVVKHRLIGSYDRMIADLTVYEDRMSSKENDAHVLIGMMCLALNASRGRFGRGHVIAVLNDSSQVLFVDDGNTDEIKNTKIYPLPTVFKSTFAFAIKCYLNPKVLTNEVEQTLTRLKKLEAIVECHFERVKSKGCEVQLFNKNGNIFDRPSRIAYKKISLNVNDICKVVVCNVSDSMSFNVHDLSLGEFYKSLTNRVQNEFANSLEERCLTLDHLLPGTPCGVRCIESRIWYRGEIQATINDNHCKVNFVDVGRAQMTSPKGLYAISNDLVNYMPQLAIPCTLNQFPFSPSVAKIVTEDFMKLVDNKVLNMTVIEIDTHSYVVNLIDYTETPPSLINMKLTYLLQKQLSLRRVTIQPPILNEIESIFVTSFVTPSLFFGQLNKFTTETFKFFVETVASYYGRLRSEEELLCDDDLNHDGEFCCAPYSEDKTFYRAKILKKSGPKVTVLFVDFGNQDVVDTCDVKILKPEFAVLPAFGIQCSIGNTFTHGIGAFKDSVKNLVLDKSMEVEILESNDDIYDVNITYCEDNKPILENLKMCGIERRSENEKKVRLEVASVTKTFVAKFKEATWFDDSEVQVIITYVTSPLQFWCRKLSAEFDELLSQLNTIPIESDIQNVIDVRPGKPCLALFNSDWNRVVVVDVCGSDVTVNYVDYGNDYTVNINSLLDIPPSMMQLPAQAIECRMANIVSTEFSADLLEKFESKTYSEIFSAKPHGKSSSGVCSIELFDSCGTNLAECFGFKVDSKFASIEPNTMTTSNWQNDDGSVFDSVSMVAGGATGGNVVADASDDWDESAGVTNGFESKLESSGAQNRWENSGHSNHRSNRDGGSWKPKDSNGWSSQNRDSSRNHNSDFEVSHDSERGYSRFIPPRMQRSGTSDAVASSERWSNNSDENSNNFRKKPQNSDQSNSRDEWKPRNVDSRGGHNSDQSNSRDEWKPRNVDSRGGHNSDHANHSNSKDDWKPRGGQSNSNDEWKPRNSHSQSGCDTNSFVSKEEMKLVDVEILHGPETLRSVRVCYVVSPMEFYCQLLELDARFAIMNEQLQSHYGGFGFIKSLTSYNSKPGSACCAKYSVDAQWYRATIQKIEGTDASIHFVDYGNDEVMPKMDLKVLEAQFYRVPRLALKCFLENVRAPNGNWTDEEMTAFEARVLDKVFMAKIVSRDSDGKYGVDLYSPCIAVESSINYQLIRERFALPSDPNNRIYKKLLSDAVKSPFAETNLNIGHRESGSISWVTSLGCFYCQISSRREELTKLESDLLETYSDVGKDLLLADLECGAACVALYKEPNYSAWCRAVILNVEVDHVYVHFIDYGNVGYVPKSDLRMILSDFKDIPMQAIRCQLFGVKPLTEEWPMLEGDQLKDYFKGTTTEFVFRENSTESNLIDLIIDGLSVADKLVEAGLLKQHEAEEVSTQEILTRPEELTEGFHELEVCAAHGPQMFWCRLASSTALVNEMSEELCSSDLSDLPSCPVIGLAVVCEKKEHNLLCRAIIVERLTPTEFKVLFVDFGDVSAVHFNELKICSPKFARRSHMALLCTLSGLTEESEQTAKEMFASEVVPGRRLTAHVDGKVLGVHLVTLFAVGDEVTNLNSQMGLDSEVVYVDEASREVLTAASVAEMDQHPEVKLEAISTTEFAMLGEKVEVVLTSILSPKSFWVQKTSDGTKISDFSDRLNAAYVDSYAEDLNEMKWTPSSLCVGLYSLDHMWYRASVVSVSEDSLTVVFIDYGNEETLPLVNIRRISSEFLSVSPFAVHCTLDLPSTLIVDEESSNAFQEQVGYGEEVLLVEFIRHDADQYVVKLVDNSGNDLVSVLNLGSGEAATAVNDEVEEATIKIGELTTGDEPEEQDGVEDVIETETEVEADYVTEESCVVEGSTDLTKREEVVATKSDVEDETETFMVGETEESDETKAIMVGETEESEETEAVMVGETEEKEENEAFMMGETEESDETKTFMVSETEESDETEAFMMGETEESDETVDALEGSTLAASILTEILNDVSTKSDEETEPVAMTDTMEKGVRREVDASVEQVVNAVDEQFEVEDVGVTETRLEAVCSNEETKEKSGEEGTVSIETTDVAANSDGEREVVELFDTNRVEIVVASSSSDEETSFQEASFGEVKEDWS